MAGHAVGFPPADVDAYHAHAPGTRRWPRTQARLFSNHRELFAFFNKSNQARGKQPAALADAVVA